MSQDNNAEFQRVVTATIDTSTNVDTTATTQDATIQVTSDGISQDTNNQSVQTTTNIDTQDSILANLQADVDKKDIEIQEKALLKKQMSAQNNTIQGPAKLTEAQQKRIDSIYKDMEIAVANNSSFLIKTDLSLRGIIELIAIMQTLNKFYIYHVELLKDNRNSVEGAAIDIQSANEKFDFMVSQAGVYISKALKEMDNANNTSLSLRKELELLHDATQKDLLDTKDDLAKAIETYDKLQLLEDTMGGLDKAIKDAELISEKHAKILKDMKEFVAIELTKAQSVLMLKKEEHERDLQTTRDTFISRFNELLRTLEEKGNTSIFALNEINTKTADEINTIADTRLLELKKLDIELDTAIKTLKDSGLSDIESRKNEGLDELKNLMVSLLKTLDDKKSEILEKMNNISDEQTKTLESIKNDTHTQAINDRQELQKQQDDFLKEISSMQRDYLLDMQSSNFGQLKDMVMQCLKPVELFEKELQKVEIISTQSWVVPRGVRNVYVMLRGGAASDNSTTTGGTSSFGSYLSCLGGAGQSYGAGMYGEAKSGYFTLNDKETQIKITIGGSGGTCIIYYNQAESFDLANFDTSFIKDADIPYLPNGKSDMDKEAFLQTIKGKAGLNIIKNIVELDINTSDITQDDINKLKAIDEFSSRIKDERSLKIYLARELIENKMPVEALKRHLRYKILAQNQGKTAQVTAATNTASATQAP